MYILSALSLGLVLICCSDSISNYYNNVSSKSCDFLWLENEAFDCLQNTKVKFSREHTYVFGSSDRRIDLKIFTTQAIYMVSDNHSPSYPGRANFSLTFLDNSTNRLHEDCELVSGGEARQLGG